MEAIGRLFLIFGLGLAAFGLALWFGGRFVGLGRLPGDMVLRRGNFTLYFPLMTSIILSILATLLLSLLWRR